MTATRKPAGRTLAEFQPLKPAERKLLEACQQGTVANISAERPEAANDDNIVRAAFLRFLALGGDEQAPVHEHGVQLVGAWIEGGLDMVAARVPSDLFIFDCHFDSTPVFRGAKIAGTLNLGSCHLPGFIGDNYSGRSGMLKDSHNASPFPLEGGRLGWGWEGGVIAKCLLHHLSTPIPAPPCKGKEKSSST